MRVERVMHYEISITTTPLDYISGDIYQKVAKVLFQTNEPTPEQRKEVKSALYPCLYRTN